MLGSTAAPLKGGRACAYWVPEGLEIVEGPVGIEGLLFGLYTGLEMVEEELTVLESGPGLNSRKLDDAGD